MNSIELLISLGADTNASKKNIDTAIQGLKKYYDRNPLLLNVDFNKGRTMTNLNNMIKEISSKKIELDVGFKGGNSSALDGVTKQTSEATKQLQDLKSLMQSVGNSKGNTGKGNAFFNLDLDKTIIQLENLGRKGIIASNDIDRFRVGLDALRNTGDRLTLKTIVTDMFNITSSATHADKVLNGLSNALVQVGQAQQKMGNITQKLGVDASKNSEYQRLSVLVNTLTDDIMRLQSQASRGGTDQIKLGQQMRDVQLRIKEAKYELDQFNVSAKTGATFEKTVAEAQRLYTELAKIGSVSPARLDSFVQTINGIGNSSMSSQAKILQLNRAMDSLGSDNKNNLFDAKFNEGIDKASNSIQMLQSRLERVKTVHKNTFDPEIYKELNKRIEQMSTNLTRVGNPTELRGLNSQIRMLSTDMRNFSNSAVDAGRQTKTFGEYLNTAFKKFPVWIFSASLFYAPIRSLQSLTEQTLMLDEAMTQLRRVADLPDYKFNEVLEKSIVNVGELSGKMEDYLKLVNEFARTGKNDTESLALANTATVLQNISDLNAEDSVNALTAAQIAFNIASEDSITIANKLNEVN